MVQHGIEKPDDARKLFHQPCRCLVRSRVAADGVESDLEGFVAMAFRHAEVVIHREARRRFSEAVMLGEALEIDACVRQGRQGCLQPAAE